MIPTTSVRQDNWLSTVLEGLRHAGCALVEDVLGAGFVDETRGAIYRAREAIDGEIGAARLKRAGEMGVLRIPMRFDAQFFRFFEIPEMLAVVDATVSDTAVLHLQNAFTLPSLDSGSDQSLFQATFHRDFPRVLNGYLCSVNVFFAIDEFTRENGGTLIVPGTHQKRQHPESRYLRDNAVAVETAAGSMLVFDSTLWHAAGPNRSGADRLAINHQFTRSYFKQQIDYVRALGNDVVTAQPARTQQLLGWYTRVVTSLDEYYRPSDKRLYRAGQG